MEGLRQWLLGIVFTAFAAGLARQLAPEGREQAMVRLAGGLLVTLAILRPLGQVSWESPSLEAGAFRLTAQRLALWAFTAGELTREEGEALGSRAADWKPYRTIGPELTWVKQAK